MPNFVITAVVPLCGQRDEARFDAESMAIRYLSPICGGLGGSAIRVMTTYICKENSHRERCTVSQDHDVLRHTAPGLGRVVRAGCKQSRALIFHFVVGGFVFIYF